VAGKEVGEGEWRVGESRIERGGEGVGGKSRRDEGEKIRMMRKEGRKRWGGEGGGRGNEEGLGEEDGCGIGGD